MRNDSSIEEILPDLYKIKLPLPGIPLPGVNCYLVKGLERSLIIDPGLDHQDSLASLKQALDQLAVDTERIDFFCTHMHLDHLGLVRRLRTGFSKIYLGQRDVEHLQSVSAWEQAIDFAISRGFPERDIRQLLEGHPGYDYMKAFAQLHLPFTSPHDKQVITAGRYRWSVVETPGHANGHLCLYEPEEGVLLSGDHILDEITPTVQLWSDEGNPLAEYLASLDKTETLDVKLVLPGHGSIFTNCKERIKALKEHRAERAREVISLLGQRRRTPYELASQMTWNVGYDSWDRFSVVQKWFSTGETIAHLTYLEEKGSRTKERAKRPI